MAWSGISGKSNSVQSFPFVADATSKRKERADARSRVEEGIISHAGGMLDSQHEAELRAIYHFY
jgi:hypothetical protein